MEIQNSNLKTQNWVDGRKLIVIRVKNGEDVRVDEVFEFDKPRQKGEIEYRVVVDNGGKIFLKGKIKIGKKAEFAEAFLKFKVLLLGESSKAEVVPELEIETNEVKASHSAIVSTIDEEGIFYLMSRGLLRSEAEKTIVEAFVRENN